MRASRRLAAKQHDGKPLFAGADDAEFDPCAPYIRMLPVD